MIQPPNPYALGTWQNPPAQPAAPKDPLAAPTSPAPHERANEMPSHGAPPEPEDWDDANPVGDGSGEGDGGADEADEFRIARDPNATVRDFSRPDEYARRALNHARATAKRYGYKPRRGTSRGRFSTRDATTLKGGFSGARPDARDPQGFKTVLARVLGDLGWEDGMSQGQVLADWEQIVGPQIAQHCEVASFEDGQLVVAADSSVWASQLRMLTPQLITTIHEYVGRQIVTELKVTGPQGVSWVKGKRTVKWRGPRDTYG